MHLKLCKIENHTVMDKTAVQSEKSVWKDAIQCYGFHSTFGSIFTYPRDLDHNKI